MKVIVFFDKNGNDVSVGYDETAKCFCCGLPIIEASADGVTVCKWCCDQVYRDGGKWNKFEHALFSTRLIITVYAYKDLFQRKDSYFSTIPESFIDIIGGEMMDVLTTAEVGGLLVLTNNIIKSRL